MRKIVFLLCLFFMFPLRADYVREKIDFGYKDVLTESVCEKVLQAFVDDHPDALVFLKDHDSEIHRQGVFNTTSIFAVLNAVRRLCADHPDQRMIMHSLNNIELPWAWYFRGVYMMSIKEPSEKQLHDAFNLLKNAYERDVPEAFIQMLQFYLSGHVKAEIVGDFDFDEHLEDFEDFAEIHQDAAQMLSEVYGAEGFLHDEEKSRHWRDIAAAIQKANEAYAENF